MLTKKRSQKIKCYVKHFCNDVYTDFPEFKNKVFPKVRLYREYSYTTIDNNSPLKGMEDLTKPVPNIENSAIIEGFFDRENEVIEIYGITKETLDALRHTVRHECLHFILYKNGLPYKDEDSLFLTMAIKYNANPYQLLKDHSFREYLYSLWEDHKRGRL